MRFLLLFPHQAFFVSGQRLLPHDIECRVGRRMSTTSNYTIIYTWIRELRVDVLPAPLLTELHCAGAPASTE